MLRNAWLVVILFSCPWNVYAVDNIRLTLDSAHTGIFQANNISVLFHWQDAQRLSISITAASITSKYFKPLSAFKISCDQTTFLNGQYHCADGTLAFRYPDHKEVNAAVSFSYTPRGNWELHLADLDFNLPVFSALFQNLKPSLRNYKITGGHLRGQLVIGGNGRQINNLTLNSSLEGFSLEGENTLQDVTANLQLDLSNEGGTWATRAAISIPSGAMYIVPGIKVLGDKPGFYIAAGSQPLSARLAGRWDSKNRVFHLDKFYYNHPGILDLQGSAEIAVKDTITLPFLTIKTHIAKLAKTFPVYIQPLLLNTNFSDIGITGGLTVDLDYQAQQLKRLELKFGNISVDDKYKRFSLSDLAGNLSIRSDTEPVQSSLSWKGMSFHRLDFGSGAVDFTSVAGRVNVSHWQNVSVLDGKLEIEKLNMQNIGSPDFQLTLDANLSPISMQAFTEAMQWPRMTGTLSGTFHGLKYSHNNLQLNGDVDIRLFHGDVVLRNLYISDLFSEYSRLSANIDVQHLDLESLTNTFTFGKIEGTLNGHVSDLVLENWQPVHFDASFETPKDDDKPHRISQKALNNLNSLGGGLSGTMSRGITRFFKEYSYGQIGLSCRLNGGICELGGVKDTGDGFYLLTRGGLLPPWVEVKGTGRSIKWTHLIDGLKQIVQGEVKIE